MKKRKLCSLLLASIMAASALCGCSKELPPVAVQNSAAMADPEDVSGIIIPEEGAKLLLWTDKQAYGEAIAKGFMEAYPGVTVTAEEVALRMPGRRWNLTDPQEAARMCL